MPGFPDLRQPLSDGTVTLRPAAERDIPEVLIAYQDDPTLHLRLGQDRPPSGADLGLRSERAAGEWLTGTSLTLTVVMDGSDVCCGQLQTAELDWHHARTELSIWLAPQVRGRGFASRALTLGSTWLLRECELRRLALLVESDNAPMLGAAGAAGYVEEGLLRGYRRVRGARVDTLVLALVADDLAR